MPVDDAHREVRTIARRFGVPVRRSNLCLPDVRGGNFTCVCRLGIWSLPVRLMANAEWLLVEIEQETRLCFAGPVPDKVLRADLRLGTFAGMEVFIPSWFRESDELVQWLGDHANELMDVMATDGERCLIAMNKSTFLLRPIAVETDLARLEQLVAFAERLPHAEPSDEAVIQLPASMGDLDASLQTWAASDDEHRAELIQSASDQALQRLWVEVSPHFGEINALLDDEPPGGTVLGHLAQAALEARGELRRRGISDGQAVE